MGAKKVQRKADAPEEEGASGETPENPSAEQGNKGWFSNAVDSGLNVVLEITGLNRAPTGERPAASDAGEREGADSPASGSAASGQPGEFSDRPKTFVPGWGNRSGQASKGPSQSPPPAPGGFSGPAQEESGIRRAISEYRENPYQHRAKQAVHRAYRAGAVPTPPVSIRRSGLGLGFWVKIFVVAGLAVGGAYVYKKRHDFFGPSHPLNKLIQRATPWDARAYPMGRPPDEKGRHLRQGRRRR